MGDGARQRQQKQNTTKIMADNIWPTGGQHCHTCGMECIPKQTQWVYQNHHFGTDSLGHGNIVKQWAPDGNVDFMDHGFY